MKLDRIVVAVDFSAPSLEAARWTAASIAGDAEVVLAHVVAIPDAPPIVRGRFPKRDLLVETVRDGADRRLRELSHSLPSERIWLEIVEGAEPAAALAKLADDFSADLLVTGTHGERPGAWEGLGSTAEHLVRQARVPMLLVAHARGGAPAHIVVPVAEPQTAALALGWAALLARPSDARVTALHVTSQGFMQAVRRAAEIVAGAPPSEGAPPLTGAPEDDGTWLEGVVRAGVPRERAASEIVTGDPTPAILAAAERLGADLVVMGRSEGGELRRAVLGSVVAGVLRRAPCPVLVVPEPLAR